VQGQGYPPRHRRTWIRSLRWVLVAGSLALAGVLLYRHDYIIGFLIGGLALVRVIYLVGTSRRAVYAGRPYGTPPGEPGHAGPVRGALRELARKELVVAASQIGLDANQMRRAFKEGRSIAELAAGAGVALESIVRAMVADATRAIDQKVAAGQMDERVADRTKARLPVWAGRLVNFHKGDLVRSSPK
jgi:hypothetical protein